MPYTKDPSIKSDYHLRLLRLIDLVDWYSSGIIKDKDQNFKFYRVILTRVAAAVGSSNMYRSIIRNNSTHYHFHSAKHVHRMQNLLHWKSVLIKELYYPVKG